MTRRQLLRLLGWGAPAWGALALAPLVSCKEKLPSTPTIVKGKIIDENGNPLEGAGLRLSGSEIKGYTGGGDTFSITVESDKEGNYELSQLVPKNTDQIDILPMSTDKVPLNIGVGDFVAYLSVDGIIYGKIGSPYFIPYSEWGKTTTLHYQFKKR